MENTAPGPNAVANPGRSSRAMRPRVCLGPGQRPRLTLPCVQFPQHRCVARGLQGETQILVRIGCCIQQLTQLGEGRKPAVNGAEGPSGSPIQGVGGPARPVTGPLGRVSA